MTEQHLITPSHELVEQWFADWNPYSTELSRTNYVATQAARWGADQELEACLDELYKGVGLRIIDHGSRRELLCSDLRFARRPKPPSLKEQALSELETMGDFFSGLGLEASAIRRALEQLNDNLDAPAPKTVQAVVNTAAEAKKRNKKPKKYRRHLSAATVRQIKTALDSGMSNSNVARLYSVHYSTVLKIARGQTYKNVVM